MVSNTRARKWNPVFDGRAASIASRIGWFILWVVTTLSVIGFVVGLGSDDGGTARGMALIATAVGFFGSPDLAFVIGAGEPHDQGRLPRRTVPFYNAMHRIWAPLALTALSGWVVVASPSRSTIAVATLVGGLSWIAHVAIDRAVGFGLRNADGSL